MFSQSEGHSFRVGVAVAPACGTFGENFLGRYVSATDTTEYKSWKLCMRVRALQLRRLIVLATITQTVWDHIAAWANLITIVDIFHVKLEF